MHLIIFIKKNTQFKNKKIDIKLVKIKIRKL